MDSLITVRYAKALFQSASEEKKLDEVYSDILAFELCIKDSLEFKNFLKSPIIIESMKVKIFADLFSEKVTNLSLTFLNILTKNKREQYLPGICQYFRKLYNEKQGFKDATIITATPLEKEHKEQIIKLIKKKFATEVKLDEQVNPSIIGGFKLRIEDQQIDASISSSLMKIKRELINS